MMKRNSEQLVKHIKVGRWRLGEKGESKLRGENEGRGEGK